MRLAKQPLVRPVHARQAICSLASALAVLAAAAPAAATGMQGHMYMAQCAAEQAKDARLRALFDARPTDLANGAFFPDSGYTSADHDQGEIAHWEQYVQGYIEIIRERYKAPYDSPEAAAHVAFLMGLAAHGISDSTFDALFFDRAAQIEPGDMNSFDTAMDIFFVHDQPRYFVPEPAHDAQTLSDVYTLKIQHPVTPKAVDDAMSTARSGIALVAKYLHEGADDYGKQFPWARAHLRDGRTPGAYAFGAKVVGGYYREILRRLDGDNTADQVVIGTYPDASYPLVTLDPTRPDGKVVFFFGHGLDRAFINASSVVLKDEMGNVVPAKVSVFRGDKWANVITVEAQAPWQPGAKYTAVLSKDIKTLNGTSPTQDFTLSFVTCTPPSPGADCAEPAGPPPPSACPDTDAKYAMWPSDTPVDEPPTDEPPTTNPPASNPPPGDTQSSSACAAAPGGLGVTPWSALALALVGGALGLRRWRRGQRDSGPRS